MDVEFRGVYTALVTPFSADGAIVDFESLERLIAFQERAGIDGYVVCGSTGEAATLSDAEYEQVVKEVRRLIPEKPVIAGISVSSTKKAVEMATVIQKLGCDGVLLATPPYNKPTQSGIAEHFRQVRSATSLPIIAYNIPSRSGVPIDASTLGLLSRSGVIAGVKESSGSLDNFMDVRLAVEETCSVLSGEDSLFLGTLACGGQGIISASANVLPAEIRTVWQAWKQGAIKAATEAQLAIVPRIRLLFRETNPVPVKSVLARLGVINSAAVRLPLVPPSDENYEVICKAFI